MRVATLLLLMVLVSRPMTAQEAPLPAAVALQLRNELELDETQAAKLRDLAKVHDAAYRRVVATYLRAEADVIDAARSDDLALRRTALEKRSRLAIDAEISWLRWEKEARALLNAKQVSAIGSLQARTGDRRRPVWHTLVGPTVLAVSAAQPSDSGEMRIAVMPVYADIYLDAVRIGTGRKFVVLPVGKYELKLHAVGCAEVVMPVEVTRGPPMLINQTLTCGK